MSMDCLFCKIVSGAIPADIVHRDEQVTAFRDIQPRAPTHILVVPNRHIASLGDIEQAEPATLAALLRRPPPSPARPAWPTAATASSPTSARTPARASPTCTCMCSAAGHWAGRRADGCQMDMSEFVLVGELLVLHLGLFLSLLGLVIVAVGQALDVVLGVGEEIAPDVGARRGAADPDGKESGR